MFCANCGKSVNEIQNFCNGCGARIGKSEMTVYQPPPTPPSPQLFVAAGLVGVTGIVGFFAVLKILLESRLDQFGVIVVLAAYLIAVFKLTSLMFEQFRRRRDQTDRRDSTIEDYEAPAALPRQANTNQLEAMRETFIPSITEETTRTLDRAESKY